MTEAWLTPETLSGVEDCYQITVPTPLLRYVTGALAELTFPENWELDGAVTPEDAAQWFTDWLYDFTSEECPAMQLPTYRRVQTSTQSIPHNTWTLLQGSGFNTDLTVFEVIGGGVRILQDGLYIFTMQIYFPSNSTGRRVIRVHNTNSGFYIGHKYLVNSADLLTLGLAVHYRVQGAPIDVNFSIFQDSGASMTIDGAEVQQVFGVTKVA